MWQKVNSLKIRLCISVIIGATMLITLASVLSETSLSTSHEVRECGGFFGSQSCTPGAAKEVVEVTVFQPFNITNIGILITFSLVYFLLIGMLSRINKSWNIRFFLTNILIWLFLFIGAFLGILGTGEQKAAQERVLGSITQDEATCALQHQRALEELRKAPSCSDATTPQAEAYWHYVMGAR